MLALSSEGNKYFNDVEPWNLIKVDSSRAKKRLYFCVVLARALAILSSPFMPGISQKIWEQLNLKGKSNENGNWNLAKSIKLPKNYSVGKPNILFKQISDEDIEKYKSIVANGVDLEDFFKK